MAFENTAVGKVFLFKFGSGPWTYLLCFLVWAMIISSWGMSIYSTTCLTQGCD